MSLDKSKEFNKLMEDSIKQLNRLLKKGKAISNRYLSVDVMYYDVRLCCEITNEEDYQLITVTAEDSEIDLEPILTPTQVELICELINEQLNDLP